MIFLNCDVSEIIASVINYMAVNYNFIKILFELFQRKYLKSKSFNILILKDFIYKDNIYSFNDSVIFKDEYKIKLDRQINEIKEYHANQKKS
jgi:hypothetical protein